MADVLFIGEAPSRPPLPGERALSGRCGIRLANLCGLSLVEFLAAHDTINLIPSPLFPGEAWDPQKARDCAARLDMSGYRLVVLCGRRVATAFGHPDAPFLTLVAPRLALVPHPSGRCRWWNDDVRVFSTSIFLCRLIAQMETVTQPSRE